MASPRSASGRQSSTYGRRYRRSSFNGAKRLNASGAKTRRVLVLIGLLVVALLATLAVVAIHLGGNTETGAAPK